MVTGESDDEFPAHVYPDNDVTGMIHAVIAEHPEATRKFMVTTPAIMAKNAKAKTTKAQRNTAKRTAAAADLDLDSDDDDMDARSKSKSKPTAKSKGKKKKADTDDDEPPATITYYISIARPAPAVPKKRGAAKAADDDVQKGPFSVPISAPYSSLLSAIAIALPCRAENIYESKILWKPKKPKNAEKLPLGKAAGYKVMIEEMEDKATSARQVLLYMPAPAKPMEDETPWEKDGAVEPTFDYSELEPTLASDSLYAQKLSFNKTTKDERAKLEETYPIGNNPQYPDIRVYKDKTTGFLFELNSTRIGIWASSMAQGNTDEKTPPLSKFFDAQHRIKMKAVPAPAPPVPEAPVIPAAPAAPATPSLTELMFAHILSQAGGGGGGLGALFPQLHAAPPAPPAPPLNPAPLRSAPSSPIKRHNVSLDQFVELYNLEETDAVLLRDVGFRPGDPTEATLDDELKNVGFTFFSWKRVHGANVRFKGDLAKGTFD